MKYRMLLIDDEAVILKGLRNLIDWGQLNIEIVGEASDGEQGLCQICEKQPDIVISDIAMPNLSGIALLKQIRENGLGAKVIFLSGYQEFAYAQDAVRYGALDYLLKPVSAEELFRSAAKAVDQIAAERSVHRLERQDGPAERLFQNILRKKDSRDTLGEFARALNWKEGMSGAVCVGLRIAMRTGENSDENKNLIRFEIYEFLRHCLEDSGMGYLIQKEYHTCYLLLPLRKDGEDVPGRAKKLAKQITERYPVAVLVSTGERSDGAGRVSRLCQTAKYAMNLYYFEEKGYLDYTAIRRWPQVTPEDYQEKVRTVMEMFLAISPAEEVLREIREAVQMLGSIHYGSKSNLDNGAVLMAGEIFSALREYGLTGETLEAEQAQFLEDIRKKTTFQALMALFEEYYGRLLLQTRLFSRQRNSAEIAKIKKYISEHYRENLTLEDIAYHIGMNASYMSTFFKKETGQNFKAYLTEVRMKEAARLLGSTDLRTYELAEAVGYKDEKQFQQNFKKTYGVSPRQYRKRGKF